MLFALVVAGALGLVIAWVYSTIEKTKRGSLTKLEVQKLWWGLGLALSVYVLGLVAFFGYRTWFIGRAHFIAALGLLACIIVTV